VRLKPGGTPGQAKSAVVVLGARIAQAQAERNSHGGSAGWGAKARSMSEERLDPAIRKSVPVLFGAVSFVLLIGLREYCQPAAGLA
jgi:hypothetical protein